MKARLVKPVKHHLSSHSSVFTPVSPISKTEILSSKILPDTTGILLDTGTSLDKGDLGWPPPLQSPTWTLLLMFKYIPHIYIYIYIYIPYWRGYTPPHLARGLAPKTWGALTPYHPGISPPPNKNIYFRNDTQTQHLFPQWYTKNTFIDLHCIQLFIVRLRKLP